MELKERLGANDIGLADASLHVIRDMILLALDATEAPNLSEQNRIEARAALAEALDAMEGRA
ncbi:hypothetical protein [uncultured Paracoccus sp.]|uniref:hypothetical protein n=1 Tax=uncultured Paracoccus sp. TaxID=189685 RepID=UPI002625D61B|nr:hypothetical protein [uncultured Paracoccus sp.]